MLETRLRRPATLLLLAVLFSSACTATSSSDKPPLQADPITQVPGLHNLYRVSDGLYRGAQPSEAAGYESLAAMGIKTVVNLRGGHDEGELCRQQGLEYVYIPMKPWNFDEQDVIRFLQVASRVENQPVFVHCRRGADRAGMAVAVYRVVVEGWSKEDAILEMTKGPYGYNPMWKKLVRFVKEMDVDELRESAGLTTDEQGEQRASRPEVTE
jgi:tyrosine-protein phosphatase SIW14